MHPDRRYGQYHQLLPVSNHPICQVPVKFLQQWQSFLPLGHQRPPPYLHEISSCPPATLPFHKRSEPSSCPTQNRVCQAEQKAPENDSFAHYLLHKSSYQQDSLQSEVQLYRYLASYKQMYHRHEEATYDPNLQQSDPPKQIRPLF